MPQQGIINFYHCRGGPLFKPRKNAQHSRVSTQVVSTASKLFMKTLKNIIIVRTFLPFVTTAILFVSAVFFVIIPMIHSNHIHRKKLATKDLTITAWETLTFYSSLVDKGMLSKEEAQQYAKSHIRSIRYGSDMKNYFWIITMRGVVVVNPYNTHLEGLNQIALKDVDGKYFIKDFIEKARDNSGGFVEYKWQWKDDPERIETKISYVKRFHDWGWVIGTGVYLDDIDEDISNFSTLMIFITFFIILMVSILTFYVVKNFIASEKIRSQKSSMAKKTESKIRLMIQAIPDMLIRFDKNGKILDIKEPITFKSFLDPGEMLGSRIEDSWPETLAKKTIKAITKTFETSAPQIMATAIEVGSKKKKPMILEAHFVLCGKNEVLATFRDITKRIG